MAAVLQKQRLDEGLITQSQAAATETPDIQVAHIAQAAATGTLGLS